jgi:4-hydroxy-4-methyl-2-oxoglutarate aldolase
MDRRRRLTPQEISQLRRWTTPTVYNGWEQITRRDTSADGFNLEEARDFMPELGPMVGRAATAVIGFPDRSPSVPPSPEMLNNWAGFRSYIASFDGPTIIVVQDTTKPQVLGSMWGEIGATVFGQLGCVGTITDGGVRDLNEMRAAGFKAMARRLCVGHGYGTILRWGGEVEVFGRRVRAGQLVHADQHGFLAIPPEDEDGLLEATAFMDRNEATILTAAQHNRRTDGRSEQLQRITEGIDSFCRTVADRFGRRGEHQ